MKRSGLLRRSGGLKRTPLRRKPKASTTDTELAARWYFFTTRDAKGRRRPCIVCGQAGVEGHHVLSQQILRIWAGRNGLSNDEAEQLRWSLENGVPVCNSCHQAHTNGSRRIPRDKLPQVAIEFAEVLGLSHRLDPPEYA